MTIDDGYIKYDRSSFEMSSPLEEAEYDEIEMWRKILFQKELIGEYKTEKIGYGNISKRLDYSSLKKTLNPQFCISATQTGKYPVLDGYNYTRVLDFDIEKNLIYAQGPKEASSEALTHGAIYLANDHINYVFHIHSKPIWKGMIGDNSDATPADISYGTIAMANSVKEVINNRKSGQIVMKGHEDGVIIFAENADIAGELTLELYHRYC